MKDYRNAFEETNYGLTEMRGMAMALYALAIEYHGLANNDEESCAITVLIARLRDLTREVGDKHEAELPLAWQLASATSSADSGSSKGVSVDE